MNIAQYLVANAYSAFSPALNAASACNVNGQPVECPQFLNTLGFALPLAILVVVVIMIAAVWKVFTKAGQPGWASIVPVYNMVVMLQVAKKPIWWVILGFIPFVNIIIGLIVLYGLAQSFGKGVGFMLGLIFLPFIFYPVLGFGGAQYRFSNPANFSQQSA
ncbi:MAG: DUF5684 domain-containing protein [Patescibacteria group bacterium]